MKILLLLLFSNILFSQTVPPPKFTTVLHASTFLKEDSIRGQEELENAFRPFFKAEKHGLVLISYNATGDEFTTGAKFKILNPSKKTIKYIWFSVAGENPVGDLVKSAGTFFKTLKGVGPVEYLEVSTWIFDDVWFTDMIETLRISTIKIQYMDGTYKSIKYTDNMYVGESAYDNLLLALDRKTNIEEPEEENIISIDEQKVYSEMDQLAEFPGGINAFRSKFNTSFDVAHMKSGDSGVLKTEVILTIEKDGSISDISANGSSTEFNNESIRTIKAIKNKWTPAKINGQSVRYRFRLPLTMNIEN